MFFYLYAMKHIFYQQSRPLHKMQKKSQSKEYDNTDKSRQGGYYLGKIYVLGTNVLLQDPYSIFSFEANEVVIPAVVLEELDSKKRYMDEIGRNARQVSKLIDGFREKGKLHEKIPLNNGGSCALN